MKILLLTLSTLSFASFIPKEEVGNCNYKKVYVTKKQCKKENEKCVNIPRKYRCEYYKAEEKLVDDTDSPIWSKRSKVTACDGQEDCQSKEQVINCSNNNRRFMINEDYSEAYCVRLKGYEQIPSGQFVAVEVQNKKDAYMSAQETKNNEAKAQKQEIKDLKVRVKNSQSIDKDVKKAILYLLRNI